MTDVVRFAQDLGLVVYDSDLAPDVAAVLVRPGEGALTSLYLNWSDSTEMRRLACGHACGLFVRRALQPEFGFVIRYKHLKDGADAESRVAIQFATALCRRDRPRWMDEPR
ncbi:hypothetical protein ABT341_00080 [Pseudonocardia alni]|uniref:hypothetical protein n=1 Tax=Pseudonocardia alni TaxID=33907 RepID=UPI003317D44D